MPVERITKTSTNEVPPVASPVTKEIPLGKNVSEVVNSPKVVTPVSWDSGCRV